ncbi:hypothetical protein GEMRC1_006336 [Eukaryota sp. GEM-RC1]
MNPFSLDHFQEELSLIVDIDSQSAPDSEPFKFKYLARERLEVLLSTLANVTVVPNDDVLYQLCVLTTRLRIGINHGHTEETTSASRLLQEYLPSFHSLIHSHNESSDITVFYSEYFEGVNALAVILANRTDYDESFNVLSSAFSTAVSLSLTSFPLSTIESGLVPEQDSCMIPTHHLPGTIPVEDLLTQLLYVLAQVRTSQGNKTAAANLLKTVLSRKKDVVSTEEKKEWSRHMLDLAEYFLTVDDLITAEDLLNQSKNLLNQLQSEDPSSFDDDTQEVQANVYGLFAKVYLAKLQIKAEAVASREEVANLAEADELYNSVIQLLEKSSEFFVLDGYVSDHIALQKLMSQAHKNRAMFESDPKVILSYHDKRRNLLEPIIGTLNHQAFCNIIRIMRLDVADTYYSISEAKAALYKTSSGSLSEKQQKKCIGLVRSGIRHCLHVCISCIKDGAFRDDVASMMNSSLGLVFDPLQEFSSVDEFLNSVIKSVKYIGDDYLDCYLSAIFLVAKLWSSIPSLNSVQEAAFGMRSFIHYQQIVEVLKNHSLGSQFKMEMDIANQMAELLKLKIAVNSKN